MRAKAFGPWKSRWTASSYLLILVLAAGAPAAAQQQEEESAFASATAQRPDIFTAENDDASTAPTAQDAKDAAANAAADAAATTARGVGGPKLEEVVVTGSRIQRDNYGGLGPISTVSADDFALKGAFSVGELLRDLPSIGLDGLSATDTNGGRGLETVDLRDLGPARTLILVNGRRFVQSSTGASEAVDLNNLPPQLIERVEVLRDGVSTIYGADAVAGVINFILRKDFEGLQLQTSGGTTTHHDGEQGDISLTWGKNFSRGNITLTGSLSGRNDIGLTDRRSSRSPIRALELDENGKPVIIRDFFSARDGVASSADNPTLAGGFFARNSRDGDPFSRGFVGMLNGTKINDQFRLTGSLYRSSANGLFTFEVSDAVEFFSELTYTERRGQQPFSETFLSGNATVKNPNGFTFPVFRPGDSRNNPFLSEDFLLAAFDQVDDTQDSVNVTLRRSLGEFGPRIATNVSKTFRYAGGFRGELPNLLGGFRWEVFGNYGRNDDRETLKNEVNLTEALKAVNPEECKKDPKCVVGNFFGENSLLTTPGAFRNLRFDSKDQLRFHLMQVGASMNGSVVDLPAGPLKMAIGTEYREEDGFATPDRRAIEGDTGGNARQRTRGRQLIREAFFESQIPILRGLPGVQEFTFEVAGRYTDYSSFGGKYLSRYGFSYAPADMLRLRGVFATSFRSPGISDLFLGSADSFVSARDRCDGFPNIPNERVRRACEGFLPKDRFTEDMPFMQSGGVGSQIRANVGGNRDVREETADTYNLGLVFTPPWIDNLEMSLDYYNVVINNPIVGQDPQQRIDDCVLRGSQVDCAALRRGDQGELEFIDIPRTNFGDFQTKGFDIGARYSFPAPLIGKVLVDFEANYIVDFETTTPAGKVSDNGQIGLPNFKGRLVTAIQPINNWQISTTARYIGRGEDRDRKDLGLPISKVKDIIYLDLATGYQFGNEEKYSFTIGVVNAMNTPPPTLIDGFSNTASGVYDVVGRRFFAAFNTRFY